MERHFEPVESIFKSSSVFTKYRVGLTFTQLVVGGTPQNPEIIESWLRQRILGDDQELAIMLRKTLDDLDIEVPEDATKEELIEAAKKIAATRNGNTFRRNGCGMALGAYQVKAMLKEATAILYPYQAPAGAGKWGATNKAARSYLAERVFVDDYLIPLGRMEPDGVLMQVGHVDSPKGKRSTLTYADYCAQPTIEFTVSSAEDCISKQKWERIFVLGERIGLGASRSLGHGQFAITQLKKVR